MSGYQSEHIIILKILREEGKELTEMMKANKAARNFTANKDIITLEISKIIFNKVKEKFILKKFLR